jgi:hypothetical protein
MSALPPDIVGGLAGRSEAARGRHPVVVHDPCALPQGDGGQIALV